MIQTVLQKYLTEHKMKVGKTFRKKGHKYKILDIYDNFIFAENCNSGYKETFTYFQLIQKGDGDEEDN